jgi:valyl-tRNA synthetase
MGYAEDMPADQGGRSIMFAPWPKPFDADTRDHFSLDDCYLDFIGQKIDLVTQGRNLRQQANVPAAKKVKFILRNENGLAPNDAEVVRTLLNADSFEIVPEYQPAKGTVTTATALGDLFLPLEGLVDFAAERARLSKEQEKIRAEIAKVEQKLANPAFVEKVPPAVLEEHRQRLADWQGKLRSVRAACEALGPD